MMKNDYDKFANSRHEEIKKGIKKSICYVERPMMESMIPNLNDKKVLIIGCGTGEETEILNKFNPKSITAIDLSESSIRICKENYPNINFIVANMLNLPFEDNYFDFVYSGLAITHVYEKEKVADEIKRVLKNNGKVLFSVDHPMRFCCDNVEIDGKEFKVIGFEKGEDGKLVLGNYSSHAKRTNYFKNNQVLEEFVAPPSYYFQLLINKGFTVDNFKESRCIDECRKVDEAYFIRFSEIPQFMAFLATNIKK